ncbi:oleate hydratase [uncultured Adlercreutzia sp.]|uniref:oleate hydratase n=1 Tax=uncultured Adlercreutzia sp. TaxID=875803 RepID=UPI00265F54E0|nr:oleate hydratase [uncultured Adlercreutzia sp.]
MYYSSGNYEAFAHPLPPEGVENKQAYIIGSGLAGLAAACFLVRDGRMPGEKIHILERDPRAGGGCDGWEYPGLGFTMRGGREMDNHFEVMWDLFRDIPSIEDPSVSVLDYYYWLNKRDPNYSLCRATVDRGRDAHTDNKFNLSDKACMEIMNLFFTPEEELQDKVITEYFSDEVLNSNFWLYWRTMFAFENWHSALEMKRYVTRFVHHLGGLPDFSALRFTRYNQYESMILPMVNYLEAHGVDFQFNTHVTDVRFSCDDAKDDNRKLATEIRLVRENNPAAIDAAEGLPEDGKTAPAADTGREETIPLTENDLVFITPGSLVAHSSFGSQDAPARFAPELTPGDGWDLWKKIAAQSPEFGRPEKFCGDPEKSNWESATVTTLDEKILPYIEAICKRDPLSGGVVTGGIVSVKDSSWLLSWTINRQPQFRAQPKGQVCVWLYGLFTDVPGDYVKKPMRDCTGKEICEEWLYHLGVPEEQIEELAEHSANTVPCMMPYITAFFMPRADGDRPLVVPEGAVNFAFIGQFAETPRDTIFTTEYSMRTGMESVYTLLDIDRGVPEVWGSVFDLRVLLNATVLLRDGKPATDMNMNVLEKLLLSRGLKEIEHTDIYGLLKEFGVIPTTDENRDVPVPATGAVWPGIH